MLHNYTLGELLTIAQAAGLINSYVLGPQHVWLEEFGLENALPRAQGRAWIEGIVSGWWAARCLLKPIPNGGS